MTRHPTRAGEHLLAVRRFLIVASAVAVLLLLAAAPVQASVLWRGDAETGNLSQWSSAVYNCRVDGVIYHDRERCGDRIRVVSSPTSGPHSRYSYRFETRDGDLSPYGGERNELKQRSSGKIYPSGSERYFGYSVRIGDDYPYDSQGITNDWTVLSGWKTLETHGSGPAALNMQTVDNNVTLKRAASPSYFLWKSPLQRYRWNRFVVRIKFHSDPKVGFVEMWKDGQLVLPLTRASTLEPMNGYADPAYSKIGNYRNEAISGTGVVWIDDYKVGTSYTDVAPPPPAP